MLGSSLDESWVPDMLVGNLAAFWETPVHWYGPDSKSVKTSPLGCLLSVRHCSSCRVSSFQVLLRMIEIIYKALSKRVLRTDYVNHSDSFSNEMSL